MSIRRNEKEDKIKLKERIKIFLNNLVIFFV